MDAHRDSEARTRQVFVDTSGRRGRTFRRFGWAVAIVCACYATTVAASLVGGSSGAPFLRIPGVTDAVAEAAEVKGADGEAEQPSWEPTIPNGTLPEGWGWEEGVVPPSATAAPAEAADTGDGGVGAAAPRETSAGGADTVASGSGSDTETGAGTGAGTGSGVDTAPTPSDTTPPAGDNAGTPPKEPQDQPDPPADEPAGNGNPVDGLLGGLLGLPPLLGG
ncbi:hypothetical protein ACFUN8_36335 [Streptomyces sp. NPDC057307]|uniref:hypothetical protein n=1 Tax=Streptomyces sp. NPDC057307 TaxID=3346096 RepID=UPI00363AD15D